MIKISKTVLSGAAPGHIREQTEGLAPAQLRELAVQLAADPDLTVSVIAYDDGRAGTGGPAYRPAAPHRAHHRLRPVRARARRGPGPDDVGQHPGRAPGCRRDDPRPPLGRPAHHGLACGCRKAVLPYATLAYRAARRRAGHGGGRAGNSRASSASDPSARPLVRDVVDKRIFGKGRQRATPISPVLLVRQVQVLHRDTRRSVASAGRDDGPAAQRALHGHLVADHALGSVAAMAPSLACRAGAWLPGWLVRFRGVRLGSGP